MKCIFKTKNGYDIPPMQADSGLQLIYQVGEETHGGFTLLESPDTERVYWIDASPETIEAMKADTKRYQWISDVEEGNAV